LSDFFSNRMVFHQSDLMFRFSCENC